MAKYKTGDFRVRARQSWLFPSYIRFSVELRKRIMFLFPAWVEQTTFRFKSEADALAYVESRRLARGGLGKAKITSR